MVWQEFLNKAVEPWRGAAEAFPSPGNAVLGVKSGTIFNSGLAAASDCYLWAVSADVLKSFL